MNSEFKSRVVAAAESECRLMTPSELVEARAEYRQWLEQENAKLRRG
jgi:hypothetical protein